MTDWNVPHSQGVADVVQKVVKRPAIIWIIWEVEVQVPLKSEFFQVSSLQLFKLQHSCEDHGLTCVSFFLDYRSGSVITTYFQRQTVDFVQKTVENFVG